MDDKRIYPECGGELFTGEPRCSECGHRFDHGNRDVPDEEAAFEVEFLCKNCGHDWWYSFVAGDDVFDHSEHPETTSARGIDISTEEGTYGVWCPVCDRDNQIFTGERNPLDQWLDRNEQAPTTWA